MNLEVPNVIHKYDVADFTSYTYWQLFFQEAGSFQINGSIVNGLAGTTLEIGLTEPPIYVSGGTELYLLGSSCSCGPFYPPYTGSTSTEYPVGTRYYYGDLGPSGGDNTRFYTR